MTDKPPEPTEVNPSEQTVSPSETRLLEAFAGMMRSRDRIRDAFRTTRERMSGDTTNF